MAIGIENLSKAIVAFSKIGSAIADAFEDKVINIKDIPEAVKIVTALPGLASINYSDLVAEVKDLDATEKVAIAELFRVNFDIINDDLEATIEEGSDILFAGFKFLGRFMKKKA